MSQAESSWIGACILSYMANYIKERINSVQLLVLWTKHSLTTRTGWVNNLTHSIESVTGQDSTEVHPCTVAEFILGFTRTWSLWRETSRKTTQLYSRNPRPRCHRQLILASFKLLDCITPPAPVTCQERYQDVVVAFKTIIWYMWVLY
jgi:hypothetical protein